jgi:hypothetical protein
MSEKTKIKTAIDTGKQYENKPIINIELEDGRKGACYNEIAKEFKPGQEVEFDIKEGKEYEGEKRYYFNIPKINKPGFAPKDYLYEKRRSSYELALKTAELLDVKLKKSDDICPIAEKIFEYLNKK